MQLDTYFLEFGDCLRLRKRSSAHAFSSALESCPPAFHRYRGRRNQKALDDCARIIRAVVAWQPRCGGRHSRAASSLALSRIRRHRTRAGRWIRTRTGITFGCRARESFRTSHRLWRRVRGRRRIGRFGRVEVRRIRIGFSWHRLAWCWLRFVRLRLKLRRIRLCTHRRLGLRNGIGFRIWIGVR